MKVTILFLFMVSALGFAQPKHDLWNAILQNHVSENGRVDYAELKAHPADLNAYLELLASQPPEDRWSRNELLSYWINAYNAYTLKLIIDFYPVKSIKAIRSPWSRKFIPFGEDLISLNTIEHQILRPLEEPRIHFAIVCASISCPILRNEAYRSEQLDKQLNEATDTFLNDRSKNTFNTDQAEISRIFKWFSEDFEVAGGVLNFIQRHKPISITKNSQLAYKTYNWDLNE